MGGFLLPHTSTGTILRLKIIYENMVESSLFLGKVLIGQIILKKLVNTLP